MTETEKQGIFDIGEVGIMLLFRNRLDELHNDYCEKIGKLHVDHEEKVEKLKAEQKKAIKKLHNNVFNNNQ